MWEIQVWFLAREVFIFLSHKIILRRQIASFRSFGCYCCSACIEQPPSLKRGVFPGGLQFRLDLRPQLLSVFPLQDPRNAKGHQVTEARAGPGVGRWATSHPGARAATGRSPEGSRCGARQTPQWPGRRWQPRGRRRPVGVRGAAARGPSLVPPHRTPTTE